MPRSNQAVLSLLVGCTAFLVITTSQSRARADTQIAADLDYAAPINSDADSGGGFAFRLGYQAHAPLVVLTPEVAFTYDGFTGAGDLKVYRGVGGLRVGVGEIVRPGVFMHLGVGHVTAAEGELSHTDFTYDAGAFLDFTLLPLLNIGAHAAYNHLATDGTALQFATVGVHAALIF